MASRELFIMFVYDTQRCQKEEDDPQEAVLYFHPGWVSDQQRLLLCGQLMGATQFFLTSFSCPHIVALNSGKFVIRQYGRYILTIGTDRNIPDWVIEHRSETLNQLIQFYHRDLESVFSLVGPDVNQFTNKLNQIFETYIPILPYAANMFGNIPTIRLPKSASSVFLEAVQILHCCRGKNGVLGGTVLFQNKVVASQLSSALTKRLVSSDPCRIKTPAEPVSTPFHLPVGVQLLHVYVRSKEYYKLQQNSAAARSAFSNVSSRKVAQKKVPSGKVPPPKEPLSGMKRDISRIFTVPEEREGEVEQAEVFSIPTESASTSVLANEMNIINTEDVSRLSSSACTTPMKDINLNKVLHGKALSICSKSETDEAEIESGKTSDKTDLSVTDKTQDRKNSDTRKTEKRRRRSKATNYLVNYSENEVHSLSLNDLQPNYRISLNRIPMKCYALGLPKITCDMTDDSSDYSPVRNLPSGKHFYNTITDPMHPVFRDDGLPISRSLYNENLARHYQLLDLERSEESTPGDEMLKASFSNILSAFSEKPEEKTELYEMTSNIVLKPEETEEEPVGQTEIVSGETEPLSSPLTEQIPSSKQEVYRRSLSLPLKTMTTSDYDSDDVRARSTSYTAGVLESPAMKTRTMGLPITPLMSKLSSLAIEEKTSGFCSRDTTPSEFRDLSFPGISDTSSAPEFTKRKVVSERTETEIEQDDSGDCSEGPKNAVLYLFGQQNMSLLLLLEEEIGQDPELIHSLWETSLSSLSRLEMHLRQCLDHVPQGETSDSYSFLSIDPSWDMMQKGGKWECPALEVVASIHNDFVHSPGLTEVVVRCEESTVYGYQCGKMEVFYRQPTGTTVGLPTPSDLMGVVPLKARRRLERDHGIILL